MYAYGSIAYGGQQNEALTIEIEETISINENKGFNMGRFFNETITLVDDVLPSPFFRRTFTEVISVTDSLRKTITTIFSEAISLVDNLANKAGKNLTETFSVSDVLSRVTGKVLSETISIIATAYKFLNGMTVGLWRKVGRSSDTWRKVDKT